MSEVDEPVSEQPSNTASSRVHAEPAAHLTIACAAADSAGNSTSMAAMSLSVRLQLVASSDGCPRAKVMPEMVSEAGEARESD